MNRSALPALALVLPLIALGADTSPPGSPVSDEQAVEARSRTWAQSAVEGNADLFSSFMTRDYVLLYVDPKTDQHPSRWVAKTGEEWTASIRSGAHKYEQVKLLNTKVRLNGDLAVFSGEYTETGNDNGEKYTDSGLFAETWIKRDGQWYAVDSVFP